MIAAPINLTDDPMWHAYGQALLKNVLATGVLPGGFDPRQQHFSIGSTLLFLDVNNVNPAVANTSVYTLGNSIPANSDAYITQGNFFTSYWLFLNYALLAAGHPAVTTGDGTIGPFMNPSGLPLFKTFQNSTSVMAKVRGLIQRIASAVSNTSPDLLVQAASDCATASSIDGPSVLNMPAVLSGGTVQSYLPLYTLPGLSAEYTRWQAAAASGSPEVSIDLSSADLAGGPKTPAQPVRPFLAAQMAVQQPPEAGDTDWQITAEFPGFGVLPIQPGGWFQAALLDDFKDKLPANAPLFFGDGGSLSFLPQYAVFGYQSNIRIVSQTVDSHNTWVRTLVDNKGVRFIGPFMLHPALPATVPVVDETNLTITIGAGGGEIPALLGVISKKLG